MLCISIRNIAPQSSIQLDQSKMNYIFIFCGLLLNYQSVYSQESEINAKCSKHLDELMVENGNLRNRIIEMEPFKIKGPNPCNDCVFTGVHDFKRIENTEIKVIKTESKEIKRQISVEFRNVTGHCSCDLNSGSFLSSMKTVPNSLLSRCIIKLGNGFHGTHLEVDDIDVINRCFPIFGHIILGRNRLDQFRIGANWQNAKFTFDLVSKPNQTTPVIENTFVMQNDTAGFTQMCDGSDEIIEGCKCMIEGKYMGHIFMQWMKKSLPCGLEIIGQFAIPQVLTDMACPV